MYVLIPVLDDDKHYWVGDDEVAKLLRHGEGWLASHPERELIARRYLKHRRSLAQEALARLLKEETAEVEGTVELTKSDDAAGEPQPRLNELRLNAVVAALKECNAKRVVDLGCGEGRLLALLLKDQAFTKIVGMDVSHRSLEVARDRLHLDRLPAEQTRIKLIHGSLMYRDRRLAGFDAAAVVEVVEHLDPPRLTAFERVLFEQARPRAVVLTTPNREYNVRYAWLPAGKLRLADHRFEWARPEFQAWADRVADRFGYVVRIQPIGAEDAGVGAPTQLAVFTRVGD